MKMQAGRLALVPQPTEDREHSQQIHFCSHCGERQDPERALTSRVCDSCGLGLVLQASDASAPEKGAAFLVIDNSMSVCAVSSEAEQLLATRETESVNRHMTEILVPADAEAQGAQNLAVAVTWAARGDDTERMVTVRPTNVFGVRLRARIAACGPPQAALLVFDRD
jgi:hypothetical protein